MTATNSKAKVLIVDDTVENLTALENTLHKLDVEVIRARSGNEALKATLHNDFSLILLDINMPGMTGLEVAEVLKKEESTAAIPIVFITAMDRNEADELKAYSKGAIDFLYKPIHEVILLSKVKVLLELYTMNRDLERAVMRQVAEKPKILVVDDNPDNILVMKKLLARLDADVVTALSGNEALAATIYNDFAVIFLDVQMPEMDGYEVAELLKSNERTATIPLIFITAIDRDDTKEIKGYGKGAVDFIFKPFNEFILLSKARVFLDIYAMKAGLGALVADKTAALKQANTQLRGEIQRKEAAEKELLKTRTYLISVVNSLSSLLIGADRDGVITDMNLEASRVSGVDAQEAKGKTVAEVFPFFQEITDELFLLATGNEPVEKAHVVISKRDVPSVYNFAIYPLVGSEVNQVVIRADDVTEEKKMEEELQQRRHIESLGQLAGGIAHDFNNMLSAISGATELLRLKVGDNPEIATLLDSIFVSVERSADLTGKLLSFARKKGGRKISVDMHLLINDTVDILRRSIDKRIDIAVQREAGRFLVDGDESELHNALLNLCINARDAMPDGGTLTISTENRAFDATADTRKLELQPGNYLEIRVEDTGTGMPDNVKKRVFEPFFTTKAHGKGTGLGLASVYGTMKAHSGAITLESEVGRGSAFTMLLPTSDKETPARAVEPAAAVEQLRGTVLLVDDEEVIRRVGTDMLKQLGMEVIQAENGRRALEILHKRKDEITLVILDMIMPEMNGRDCYEEIRKIAPQIAVVFCTGYAPEDLIAKLHLDGVAGFISKPFRLADLKNTLHSCIADSAQRAGAS